MTFRTYFDVDGGDASRLGEQVAEQRAAVALRLSRVDRVVAVLSGKGGVGKSYVTAALTVALARRSLAVGVLDADLQSPTIAALLDARTPGSGGGPLLLHEDGVSPALGRDGVRVMSTDLLIEDGRALRWTSSAGEEHVWRGATETGVLREFLADVRWGELDVLLVDMPPDAARLADLATLVPNLTGAVAVTIPTAESERSVARALDAAREAGVSILGIVENMSGHACRTCHEVRPLFAGNAGDHLAAAHGIPLLARLPFTRAGLDDVAAGLSLVADAIERRDARRLP
jgi:ATP-binding protein involved in chromosome partitioning